MRKSVIVIDDFYEDPDAIRELALRQRWTRKEGATYPGREAIVPGRDWSDARARLRSEIDRGGQSESCKTWLSLGVNSVP